jgi:cytochrome P450
LGAPLARTTARIAFEALLRRFSHMRLEMDHPPLKDNLALRGRKAFPVTAMR